MASSVTRLAPFDDVPINRFLGYRLVQRGDDQACVVLPLRPDYAQEGGVVHGGLLTALADTTAVYSLLPEGLEQVAMTGIELQMRFLRPAVPDGGDLEARARVLKRGRTISVCESEIRQAARLVAKGTFTFLHVTAER